LQHLRDLRWAGVQILDRTGAPRNSARLEAAFGLDSATVNVSEATSYVAEAAVVMSQPAAALLTARARHNECAPRVAELQRQAANGL
jgi:hypothetical protein